MYGHLIKTKFFKHSSFHIRAVLANITLMI